MIAQGGGGRIINISSVHEDWPMPGNTPYCLSRGGMRMLTRTAGIELASQGVFVDGAIMHSSRGAVVAMRLPCGHHDLQVLRSGPSDPVG
jgi:hypothetical protein